MKVALHIMYDKSHDDRSLVLDILLHIEAQSRYIMKGYDPILSELLAKYLFKTKVSLEPDFEEAKYWETTLKLRDEHSLHERFLSHIEGFKADVNKEFNKVPIAIQVIFNSTKVRERYRPLEGVECEIYISFSPMELIAR